jgi:hypothetical protein
VPNAHAHGVTTPTRLATPTVERATGTEQVVLGTLEPPPGQYCGIRYHLGPADPDAAGLDSSPEMEGSSLSAFGTIQTVDVPPAPFAIRSRRAAQVTLELDLELTTQRREATVLIAHDKERWFAGLAESGTDAEREAQLVDAFLGSLHASEE